MALLPIGVAALWHVLVILILDRIYLGSFAALALGHYLLRGRSM